MDNIWYIISILFIDLAHRSDNFVIGLTNTSTQDQSPVLYNYSVCGQYPGAVPTGATVSLRCNDTDLPPARYVIVQFPRTEIMNFCELNVCAKGITSLYLCFSTAVDALIDLSSVWFREAMFQI